MKINPAEIMETCNNRYREIGFSILFGVLGILFTVMAVVQIGGVWWLQRSGQIVEARVTDLTRVTDLMGSKHYLIQYTFIVDGVEYSSPNRKKDGWVLVPEDVWNITKITRTIDVRYNPEGFLNIPACRPLMTDDVFAALAMGILFLALSAGAVYMAYRNRS